jgi:hypothetical protein
MYPGAAPYIGLAQGFADISDGVLLEVLVNMDVGGLVIAKIQER